jgi:hypothetical protein
VREAKVEEEQAHDQYPFNEWDLAVDLEEFHVHVAGIEEECVAEAKKLVVLVREASKALVDLGLPPIREIPQVPRKAQ